MSDYLRIRVADWRFLIPRELVVRIDSSGARPAVARRRSPREPRVVDARLLMDRAPAPGNSASGLIELAGVDAPRRCWLLVDRVERLEGLDDRLFLPLPPSLRFLTDFVDAALVEDGGTHIALRVRRLGVARRATRAFARRWSRAIVSLAPSTERTLAP